ncbi:MAG: hypothetical protein KGQ40_15320, partial [Rhodospirillales bacterium]|nr:hypothetical protein [Rhodospirillales bacterium]
MNAPGGPRPASSAGGTLAPPFRPTIAPLLANKDPAAGSVFVPAALLREARRQKGLRDVPVPAICLLDPDGDLVRVLRRT